MAVGHRIGPDDAPVKILEFGDYECPGCQSFHSTLKAVLAEFPGSVAFIYRHFPLPYHKQAYPAARAAECAADQGRFKHYHDLLYDHSDRLGEWDVIARMAAIPRLEAFQSCMRDTARVVQVEQDRVAASSFRAAGTPAIIINGVYLAVTPDSARLHDLIAKHLARKRS